MAGYEGSGGCAEEGSLKHFPRAHSGAPAPLGRRALRVFPRTVQRTEAGGWRLGGGGKKEKTKEKFGVLLLPRVDSNEWSLLLHSARPPALPSEWL